MDVSWRGMYCSKLPLLSLQEFRQKSLDWEKQRLRYQQQVASLEAQRKALAEHSELVQVQLTRAEVSALFVGGRERLMKSFRLPSSSDCH